MGKIFNIAGPCNPADRYMLPASARLPEVISTADFEWKGKAIHVVCC